MASEISEYQKQKAEEFAAEVRKTAADQASGNPYYDRRDSPANHGSLFFLGLIELGLTEEQAALAAEAASEICRQCWDNWTVCTCWRDD
jgi:hypothetical protein